MKRKKMNYLSMIAIVFFMCLIGSAAYAGGGQDELSWIKSGSNCDEKPFPVIGFWSDLNPGTYVEVKDRPNKGDDRFKAVVVILEDNQGIPTCNREYTAAEPSILEIAEMLPSGYSLRQVQFLDGSDHQHKTVNLYRVMAP
jgi:hypothetical protein